MSEFTEPETDRNAADAVNLASLKRSRRWTTKDFLVALILFITLLFSFLYFEVHDKWTVLSIVCAMIILPYIVVFGWWHIVKYGTFTWMRLAKQPAKAIARGDVAGAEYEFQKALARANRFPPHDRRRAIMLGELAQYLDKQGRSAEALSMMAESVKVLARHLHTDPLDYFFAILYHSTLFINLKDFVAAQGMLEKMLDITQITKKAESEKIFVVAPVPTKYLECALHLILWGILLEIKEMQVAYRHMKKTDALFEQLGKQERGQLNDSWVAAHARWKYESGDIAEAWDTLKSVWDRNW